MSLAEGDNARNARRLGGVGEPLELRVVAIEHGGAARLDAQEDLGLGVGDFFQRAEIFQMHRLDRGDDRNMRAHQLRSGVISPAWFMPISNTAYLAFSGMRASDSGTPQ